MKYINDLNTNVVLNSIFLLTSNTIPANGICTRKKLKKFIEESTSTCGFNIIIVLCNENKNNYLKR